MGFIELLRRVDPTEYWYMATPYSKYPDGLDQAFELAARAAGELILRGVKVFSPISHTHPIAEFCELDPLDHELWLSADHPFMSHAYGLIVITLTGWDESKGVLLEIEAFRKAGKPVVEVSPEALDIEEGIV